MSTRTGNDGERRESPLSKKDLRHSRICTTFNFAQNRKVEIIQPKHIHPNLCPRLDGQTGMGHPIIPRPIHMKIVPKHRIPLARFEQQPLAVFRAGELAPIRTGTNPLQIGKIRLSTRAAVFKIHKATEEAIVGTDGIVRVEGIGLGRYEPVLVHAEALPTAIFDQLKGFGVDVLEIPQEGFEAGGETFGDWVFDGDHCGLRGPIFAINFGEKLVSTPMVD